MRRVILFFLCLCCGSADPDPDCHFDADPANHLDNDADPCGSGSTTMLYKHRHFFRNSIRSKKCFEFEISDILDTSMRYRDLLYARFDPTRQFFAIVSVYRTQARDWIYKNYFDIHNLQGNTQVLGPASILSTFRGRNTGRSC